jgi:hypothetical protein
MHWVKDGHNAFPMREKDEEVKSRSLTKEKCNCHDFRLLG